MPSSPCVCLQTPIPLRCARCAERVEAAERPDPIAAEAEHVDRLRRDHAQHVGFAAEPLVGAERDRRQRGAGSCISECGNALTGASAKSMPNVLVPAVSSRDASATDQASLASMRIFRSGPSAWRDGGEHRLLGRGVDADLQIEAAIAARDAVAALRRDLVRRADGEVIEIVHLAPHRAAEEPVERLADSPCRTDPRAPCRCRQRRSCRWRRDSPRARSCRRRARSPRYPTDRGRCTNGAIACTAASIEAISAPLQLSPQPTRPVSVIELHDDVAHAAALHAKAALRLPIGHADGDRLEADDFHGSLSTRSVRGSS